jgi:hypothetical protein
MARSASTSIWPGVAVAHHQQRGVFVEDGGGVARRSARFADAGRAICAACKAFSSRLMRGKVCHTRPLKKSCRFSRVGTPPVAPMNSS